MERQLISSNNLFLKAILAFAFIILFSYHLANVIQHGVEKRALITALILFPILGLANWWAFSAVHPVYFNRDFLYYTRYGKEYRVACEEINELAVLSGKGGKYCQLKFYSNRKKVRSMHFLLVSGNTSPYLLLQQLESIIKRTKPHFEADGLY